MKRWTRAFTWGGRLGKPSKLMGQGPSHRCEVASGLQRSLEGKSSRLSGCQLEQGSRACRERTPGHGGGAPLQCAQRLHDAAGGLERFWKCRRNRHEDGGADEIVLVPT